MGEFIYTTDHKEKDDLWNIKIIEFVGKNANKHLAEKNEQES
jgi:hypothetical protein